MENRWWQIDFFSLTKSQTLKIDIIFRCLSSSCEDSLYFNQLINVTITRPGFYLDVVDFYFNGTQIVYFVGCPVSSDLSTPCYQFMDSFQGFTDSFCGCVGMKSFQCAPNNRMKCFSKENRWKPNRVSETTSTSVSWQTTKSTSGTTRKQPSTSVTESKTETTRKQPSTLVTEPTSEATTSSPNFPSLKELSDGGVDINNVTQVLNDTLHYSQHGQTLNSTQISQITKICEKSSNLYGIRSKNSQQILQNIDFLLLADEDEIRNSGSSKTKLLGIFGRMVKNTIDSQIRFLDGINLGFSSKQVNCQNISHDDGLFDGGNRFYTLSNTDPIPVANVIYVPLRNLCESQQVSHLFFTIYRDRKLFTNQKKIRIYTDNGSVSADIRNDNRRKSSLDSGENKDETVLPAPSKCSPQLSVTSNTPVMSATLLNQDRLVRSVQTSVESAQQTMAHLKFNISHLPSPLHGSFKVSWWDVGNNEWASDRFCSIDSIKNGILIASCQHLTDFTVLVDGTLNDPIVCDSSLIITGYVVNGLSIICLIFLSMLSSLVFIKSNLTVTILFYIRGQIITRGDLLNSAYYIILLLFYILFVFFSDQTTLGNDNETSCVVIAAFMYFLFISSIMLNFLQGLRTVHQMFPQWIRPFFEIMVSSPAALTIGIAIPFTLSLLLAVFKTQFFERNDSFCWVRPDYLTFAIVIPITILLFNAIVCTTFVIYKIFFGQKRKLSSTKVNYYDADFWSKIWAIFIMQFSLGIPWVIQYLTLQWPGTRIWHYLFTIILGSQGTILLLIFFYRRQKLIIESRRSSAKPPMGFMEKSDGGGDEKSNKSRLIF